MNGITGTIRCDSIRESGSIHWIKSLPFLGIHVACLAAFWTGVTWKALVLCLASYVIRMFGITAGYHRYFSHRSYRTGRLFQFVLAWIGCSALQKGPLWWAAHHRHHHQHSDQQEDVHSPKQRGFWWHISAGFCAKGMTPRPLTRSGTSVRIPNSAPKYPSDEGRQKAAAKSQHSCWMKRLNQVAPVRASEVSGG